MTNMKGSVLKRKRAAFAALIVFVGAGNRTRTGDINLGKVALYQLSYSRVRLRNVSAAGYCVKRGLERELRGVYS